MIPHLNGLKLWRYSLLLILSSSFLCCTLSAEPNYKTFELGFNPQAKTKLIKSFLSPEGSLVTIRTGFVFVRDTPEVLKKIESLLKDPSLDRHQQVRITLRRHRDRESLSNHRNIEFQKQARRLELDLQLGEQQTNTRGELQQSILTASGQAAFLRLSQSQTKIKQWRRRFITIHHNVIDEMEALRVLPVVSGQKIRLNLQSVYRVNTGKGWKNFDTGELKTQVYLTPGQWMNIGGSTASHQETKRQLWGLSKEQQTNQDHLQFEVKANLE